MIGEVQRCNDKSMINTPAIQPYTHTKLYKHDKVIMIIAPN